MNYSSSVSPTSIRGKLAPWLIAVVIAGWPSAGVYAAVEDLRITEVNSATGQVEVTNTGVTTFTAVANLPFSHLANTSSFIPGGTIFSPGQSLIISVTGLNTADSDLWLYKDSNFASAGSIVSGLKWGAASNVGRTSVAVAAGIWPSTSAFVPAQTDIEQSLRLVRYDGTVPANWALGAPSPAMFFGTGTLISDPLPNVQKDGTTVYTTVIASNLASPVGVVQPDDETGRLFICDQIGKVYVYDGSAMLPTPLLDVTGRLVTFNNFFDERGLIGLATHPNFATNPKIYTLTSEPKGGIPADFPSVEPPAGFNHQGVLAEWTINPMNPNQVDVSTRREILRVDEPQANHNGGTIRFGPDGYLYLALGDGGNRDDEGSGHLPDGNAQDLGNPLGKILRIQVDGGPFTNGKYGVPADNPFVGSAGIDEIWAYGLRNPYSFSFDRGGTNQLYAADVGQGEVEEINIITAGGDYGWRLKEGSYFFDPNGNNPGFITTIPVKPVTPGLIEPIAQYDHGSGISIIGGFVYRGTNLPELHGRYVFGDFGTTFNSPSGRLFYLNSSLQVKQLTLSANDLNLGLWVKGFGEDQAGELYVCGSAALGPFDTTGVVLKLVGLTSARQWELYD